MNEFLKRNSQARIDQIKKKQQEKTKPKLIKK